MLYEASFFMTFDLLDLPLLFGCLIGLQLVFLHFRRPRGSRLASFSFVLVLFIGVWQLFVFSLMFSKNIVKLPHLLYTGFPMEFLVGPLLYFYSEATFRGRRMLRWIDSLHLLPYLAAIAAFSEIYLYSIEKKVRMVSGAEDFIGPLPLFWLVVFVGMLISKASYLALFVRNLLKFEKRVLDVTADSSIVYGVQRYRAFAWMFLGYVCLFLSLVLYLSFSHRYGIFADYLWYFLKSTWLFAFAVIAIRSGNKMVDSVPLDSIVFEVGETGPAGNQKKYAKSGLPDFRYEALRGAVEKFVVEEKPYLDSELSLVSLADRLKVHPNHLSQVINREFEQSFSDFINGYRVEYAKKLLTNERFANSLSVLEIGFEAGFNSRASFNRVFKKCTKMAPSQFRERGLSGEEPELVAS